MKVTELVLHTGANLVNVKQLLQECQPISGSVVFRPVRQQLHYLRACEARPDDDQVDVRDGQDV